MSTVIMGGTSGIGQALARKLGPGGVTVTGRNPRRLERMRAEGFDAVRLDGAVEAEVVAFFERHGPLDHLVLAFSPGPVGLGPLAGTKLADVRTAFDGKLFGYLASIQHARVTGSVTLISAASARAAMPGTVTLAAVNGAIERMVPPLAAELAPVRVNAVSPGVIDTPWWSFLPADARADQFDGIAQQLALKRVGNPAEVADAVHYLMTADYVTGTVLPVDGGLTA